MTIGGVAAATGRVFAEELIAAAEYAQLPATQLTGLGPGLWLLQEDALRREDAATRAQAWLLEAAPQLASVRHVGALVAATASAASMLTLLRDRREHATLRKRSFGHAQAETCRWSLCFDAHFPSKRERMLPFHSVHAAPELCIAVHGALGGTFVDSFVESAEEGARACGPPSEATGAEERPSNGDGSSKACVQLLLLQLKGCVLLVRTSGEEASVLSRDDALRLPKWVGAWERREFSFSSALDPLVALAALNLATLAHLSRGRPPSDDSPPPSLADALCSLRVLDPCVGTGTILAAAASLGCTRLAGADVKPAFVAHTLSNLRGSGCVDSELDLCVHDATDPLPQSLLRPELACSTLVVSNPPWGKNVGDTTDGAAIVRSITGQCAGATFCWIANSRAMRALQGMREEVTIVRRVPFGAVELVVATAPCGESAEREQRPA